VETIQAFWFSEKTTGQRAFTLKAADVPAGVYLLTARLDGEIVGTRKVIME